VTLNHDKRCTYRREGPLQVPSVDISGCNSVKSGGPTSNLNLIIPNNVMVETGTWAGRVWEITGLGSSRLLENNRLFYTPHISKKNPTDHTIDLVGLWKHSGLNQLTYAPILKMSSSFCYWCTPPIFEDTVLCCCICETLESLPKIGGVATKISLTYIYTTRAPHWVPIPMSMVFGWAWVHPCI
jgi:hypothetical protein